MGARWRGSFHVRGRHWNVSGGVAVPKVWPTDIVVGAGTGANSIYFQAVKSHGGDGDSTMNPFVDSNVNGLLDEDILDQWETWFTAMDNAGIAIFFMFYDDNSRPYGSDPGRNLGRVGSLAINLDFRRQTRIRRIYSRECDLNGALSILERALGRYVLMDTGEEVPPDLVEGRREVAAPSHGLNSPW